MRLKLTGKPYIGKNGIPHLGKEMQPPCESYCRQRCYERLSHDQRLDSFNTYYGLANLHRQWEYLAKHVNRSVPKFSDRPRKYYKKKDTPPKVITKKRSNNIRYYLDAGWERVRVCKKMFLATFDITEAVSLTAIQKSDANGRLIDVDRRGVKKENLKKIVP